MGIFRTPAEESADLYPGLVVHDGHVTGSITAGATRLPLWAFVGDIVAAGWEYADTGNYITEAGLSQEEFSRFLYCLLEMRGEFGRLLLTMANAERSECARFDGLAHDERPWYRIPAEREPVLAQLRRCVAALEAE